MSCPYPHQIARLMCGHKPQSELPRRFTLRAAKLLSVLCSNQIYCRILQSSSCKACHSTTNIRVKI